MSLVSVKRALLTKCIMLAIKKWMPKAKLEFIIFLIYSKYFLWNACRVITSPSWRGESGAPLPLQDCPAGPEFLMNIDSDRETNTIYTEASDGNTINNKCKELLEIITAKRCNSTFIWLHFSRNWSFCMASLWREVRNIFQYLIRNHLLVKDILVFQIWCLASVEQMGFSLSSF